MCRAAGAAAARRAAADSGAGGGASVSLVGLSRAAQEQTRCAPCRKRYRVHSLLTFVYQTHALLAWSFWAPSTHRIHFSVQALCPAPVQQLPVHHTHCASPRLKSPRHPHLYPAIALNSFHRAISCSARLLLLTQTAKWHCNQTRCCLAIWEQVDWECSFLGSPSQPSMPPSVLGGVCILKLPYQRNRYLG